MPASPFSIRPHDHFPDFFRELRAELRGGRLRRQRNLTGWLCLLVLAIALVNERWAGGPTMTMIVAIVLLPFCLHTLGWVSIRHALTARNPASAGGIAFAKVLAWPGFFMWGIGFLVRPGDCPLVLLAYLLYLARLSRQARRAVLADLRRAAGRTPSNQRGLGAGFAGRCCPLCGDRRHRKADRLAERGIYSAGPVLGRHAFGKPFAPRASSETKSGDSPAA